MRIITVKLDLTQMCDAEHAAAVWQAFLTIIRAVRRDEPLELCDDVWDHTVQPNELHVLAGAQQYADDELICGPRPDGGITYTIAGPVPLRPVGPDRILVPGIGSPVHVTDDTHPGQPLPEHGHFWLVPAETEIPWAHEETLHILVPMAKPARP